MLIISILSFNLNLVYAQKFIFSQYKNEEEKLPRISNLWRAGEYLVFDCLEQSFICVSKKSFEKCTKRRNFSKTKKETVLACAPLKKYETFDKCIKSQYGFIQKYTDKRFCRNFDANL